jgi:hypothetical protein
MHVYYDELKQEAKQSSLWNSVWALHISPNAVDITCLESVVKYEKIGNDKVKQLSSE